MKTSSTWKTGVEDAIALWKLYDLGGVKPEESPKPLMMSASHTKARAADLTLTLRTHLGIL